MRYLCLLLLFFPAVALADSATLQVNGMHCTACALKLEAALLENPAIEKVHVDVEAGRIDVTGAEGADLDKEILSTIVTDTGYRVTGIEVRE